MGDAVIDGMQEAAAPYIEKTKNQIASIPGAKLGNVLTTDDERITAEKALRKTGSRAPAAAISGPVPSGVIIGRVTGFPGRGYINAQNQWQQVSP
jgi:hypothetical protein